MKIFFFLVIYSFIYSLNLDGLRFLQEVEWTEVTEICFWLNIRKNF